MSDEQPTDLEETPKPTPPLVLPEALRQRWEARTVPLDGGHLGWTGARWMRFNGVSYTGARVAFMLRTGREPVGIVKADCDMRGCVAMSHVEDRAARQRNRMHLRAVKGLPEMPTECQQGHDQAVFGRLQRDGSRYCHACQTGHSAAYMGAEGQERLARELQARYYADETIREIATDLDRSYGYVRNLLASIGTDFRTPNAKRSAA